MREWEYEIAHDLAPHVADSRVAARAYRPCHPAHVPDGALRALGEAVGALTVRDLLVVPAATRPGSRRGHIFTPVQVLGVGPRGVALWVDGAPEPGVWVVISSTDIDAMSDRPATLSSYLSVHGSARQLPLRYHAVHRHLLDDLLIRLRQQATRAERATPQLLVEPDRWPARWHAGTASTTVRLGREPAMAAAFGRLPARRRRPACDCLVTLTADELVVVRSPDRAGGTADRLYVPRCRLRRVEVVAHELRVHTPGVGFAITLDPAMIPSVCAALAPALSPNTP